MVFSAIYAAMGLVAMLRARGLRRFEDGEFPEPAQWPALSVVVPACDEASTLESASASLRAQDYPDLQILLVDDRSRDGTAELVDRIAASDQRVTPLHIAKLPAGWLGKVHALHVASLQARGQWLLFTDADVHFSPGALRQAIAMALHENLDHLSLLPRTTTRTLAGDVGVATFGGLFMLAGRADQVGKPGSDVAVGVGAFNLVRADSLRATAGFPWLALEIADDFGLATLIQQAGGRGAFAVASQTLAVEWYADLPAMIRGLDKNMFAAAGQFSWPRSLAMIFGFVAMPLGMFAGLAFGALVTRVVALLTLIFVVWTCQVNMRKFQMPALPALFLPFGHLTMGWILLHSAWKTTRQGGIIWRGTWYPLAELRAGQRVSL